AWYKGNFQVQALLYAHMGNAYMGRQVWDSAALYYKLALSEAMLVKANYTIHLAYKGLADLALKQDQPELAIYYLKQAAIPGQSLHPENASEASATLGLAYSETGEIALAHYHLRHALDISRSAGLLQNSMDAHLQLARL